MDGDELWQRVCKISTPHIMETVAKGANLCRRPNGAARVKLFIHRRMNSFHK